GTAAVYMGNRPAKDRGDASERVVKAPEKVAPEPPPPVVKAAEPPPPVEKKAEPPPAELKAAKITLKIDSDPPAAAVYRAADGGRVGKTPFAQQLAPSVGEAVFTLKHAGYHDAPAVLPTDRDGALSVKLVRATHASAPRATPVEPAKPAAAPPA